MSCHHRHRHHHRNGIFYLSKLNFLKTELWGWMHEISQALKASLFLLFLILKTFEPYFGFNNSFLNCLTKFEEFAVKVLREMTACLPASPCFLLPDFPFFNIQFYLMATKVYLCETEMWCQYELRHIHMIIMTWSIANKLLVLWQCIFYFYRGGSWNNQILYFPLFYVLNELCEFNACSFESVDILLVKFCETSDNNEHLSLLIERE